MTQKHAKILLKVDKKIDISKSTISKIWNGSIFLRLIIFVEYKMAKKLKRKKSKILQNMNPDFVNKLANIMGGRSC